jgi:hypothetical protein
MAVLFLGAMEQLTSHVLDPRCAFEGKYVVCGEDEVGGLVKEEVMPGLWLIGGIIENGHGKHQLGNNNSDTGTDCDPAEDIGGSTAIALFWGWGWLTMSRHERINFDEVPLPTPDSTFWVRECSSSDTGHPQLDTPRQALLDSLHSLPLE